MTERCIRCRAAAIAVCAQCGLPVCEKHEVLATFDVLAGKKRRPPVVKTFCTKRCATAYGLGG